MFFLELQSVIDSLELLMTTKAADGLVSMRLLCTLEHALDGYMVSHTVVSLLEKFQFFPALGSEWTKGVLRSQTTDLIGTVDGVFSSV